MLRSTSQLQRLCLNFQIIHSTYKYSYSRVFMRQGVISVPLAQIKLSLSNTMWQLIASHVIMPCRHLRDFFPEGFDTSEICPQTVFMDGHGQAEDRSCRVHQSPQIPIFCQSMYYNYRLVGGPLLCMASPNSVFNSLMYKYLAESKLN